MGCMEHVCVDCGHFEVNNVPTELSCPHCTGRMQRFFDESPEPEYPDDWEPEEDD